MSVFVVVCLCVIAILVAIGARFPRTRFWLVNLSAAVLALALYEIYLDLRPSAPLRNASLDYMIADPELGYALKPGPRIVDSTAKKPDGSVIFDAHYGIDEHGIRRSSEPVNPRDRRSVWFVGDSFTFGIGLNDEDTLPSQFAQLAHLRVVNFGIGGQGAHQVLRELETGRVRGVDGEDPLAIVYLALPSNHMLRAAGRAPWDQSGPRYEIADGGLQFSGHFQPHEATIWEKLLGSSRAYDRLVASPSLASNSQQDRDRLLAIILKCRDLSASTYHAPFFVLVWKDDANGGHDSDWLLQQLSRAGVPTLDLGTAIPDLLSGKYQFPGDGHPMAAADRLIAEALDPLIEQTAGLSAQR